MSQSALDHNLFTQNLNPAILTTLQRSLGGATILETTVVPHSTSLWSTTARVTATIQYNTTDGGKSSSSTQEKEYFLKVASGETGKVQMHGEYESMLAIHNVTPSFCPKPVGWGSYYNPVHDNSVTGLNLHFIVMEFVPMDLGSMPPPAEEDFCKALAQLHSQSSSRNGLYGFHVTTCVGNIQLDNTWHSSWQSFFTRRWRDMLQLYVETTAVRHEDLINLATPFCRRVIPRLLGALEADDGRASGSGISPALVHGNLWYGNTSQAVLTGNPIVFGAGAFYAHNEFELGNWRRRRNNFGPKYFTAYRQALLGGRWSEPQDEFDDRNALYSTLFNLYAANLFPHDPEFPQLVVYEMGSLLKKYGLA